MTPLFWIAFFFIILNVVYIVVGAFSARGIGRSLEAYLVAKRGLGNWITILGLMATWFSAYMFLGLYGASYRTGLGPFVQGYILIACSVSFLLLGIPTWFLGKKYGYMSSADFLSDRYESRYVGLLQGLAWIIFTMAMLMVNMIGAGALLHGLTNGVIPFWVGVVAITIIMLSYLIPGGTRSMAWVDALQGIILLTFLWISFYILFQAAGGNMVEIVNKFVGTAEEKLLTIPGLVPQWTYGVWFFQGVFGLTWGAFPHMYIRWYAARSPKVIIIATLITAALGPLIFWHGAWGGPIARVIEPGLTGAATDSVLPILIARIASPLFIGLLFAGAFAAIMSTTSSMAMGVSAIGTRDIYRAFINPEATENQAVTASRISLTLFLLLGMILSFSQPQFLMTLGMLFLPGDYNLVRSFMVLFTGHGLISTVLMPGLLLVLFY
ncbi:sodium:solute symporter family protein [candidate division WWE3 bacterium]|jgi:SSS family solute:Na+ symporter|uniref:Sodium:solute symporter family protein n=1 Tax=candidate division WWE3 bacterium TaxID=2053526 RepID=A0A3A4ZDE9_UNCKA|nr:MAG: sodium:solute symporter family protein [candidate division WWE3 bacterium]